MCGAYNIINHPFMINLIEFFGVGIFQSKGWADLVRNSWHALPTSHICGMLTRDHHITRVYVVTIDALMDDLLDWTPFKRLLVFE